MAARALRSTTWLVAIVAISASACGLGNVGLLPAGVDSGEGPRTDAGALEAAPENDGGGGDVHAADSSLDGGNGGNDGDAGLVDASPIDAGLVDTSPNDVGVLDAPSADACAATCSPGLAVGWTRVAFAGSRMTPCPGGFTSDDVIENPSPEADACTCAPCTIAPGSCTTGSVQSWFDDGSGTPCGQKGLVNSLNGGACLNMSQVSFGAHASVDAPVPMGGGCSASGVANPSMVTSQAERLCRPPSTCDGEVCDPAIAPAYASCIELAGDQSCPVGIPTKHLVADAVTVSCPACGCTLSATCSGSMTFYGNPGCSGVVATLAAGTCTDTAGAQFQSYEWTGTVEDPQCSLTAGSPTLVPMNPVTVCCP